MPQELSRPEEEPGCLGPRSGNTPLVSDGGSESPEIHKVASHVQYGQELPFDPRCL
jgi:hypothetical protein